MNPLASPEARKQLRCKVIWSLARS